MRVLHNRSIGILLYRQEKGIKMMTLPGGSTVHRTSTTIQNNRDVITLYPRRPLKFREKLKFFLKGELHANFDPPSPIEGKKTLILDLDETLVHFSTFPPHSEVDTLKFGTNYVFLRPGLKEFLEYARQNFEVFIFTAGTEEYANPILLEIMPWMDQCHKLFRDSCYIEKGHFRKDASILDRDKKDVIIIDDSSSTFKSNPRNTIPIARWEGAPGDSQLTDFLIPLLNECLEAKDVRKIIKDRACKHVKEYIDVPNGSGTFLFFNGNNFNDNFI